jgi:hypothetical protein
MSYEYYTYSSELYHHGVKGMKWGVRRYQNADGSLTAKGKKRYSKEKAYQGKMNIKQTEAYARERIKTRGARQALADEYDTYEKAVRRPAQTAGTIGAVSGGVAGGIAGAGAGGPVTSAALAAWGAAFVGGLSSTAVGLITMPSNIERGKQYAKNVDAIKRIADIPDATIGERYNVR